MTKEKQGPEKNIEASLKVEELRAEISVLQLQKAQLQADYNRLQQLYDKAPLGYQSLDENGCFLTVNQAWLDILGYRREEVIGRSFADFLHPDWQGHFRENFPRFKALGEILGVEFEMRRKDGGNITVAFDGRIGRDGDGNFLQTHCIFKDITARRAEEARREAERRLLHICHHAADTKDLVDKIIAFFREFSKCEAVGVRLRLGDDYPYYESRGFPPHFLRSENSLCTRGPDGAILRDGSGHPVLECMCGNIIRGFFNPALPFFTSRGSFWTNCTSELLASTTEADRQARTRNRCNGEGYQSVALIPFRLRDETFGLLQLNDRARDRFTPQLIAQLEELAAYVSLSFSKHLADTFRQETEDKYRLLIETAQEGIVITTAEQGLLLLNPAAARIASYPAAELSGKTFADLVHPDDLTMVADRHRRRLSGENLADSTCFRIIGGDGRVKWLEVKGSLIRWQGQPAVLNFITDITERKAAEEAMRASEERFRGIFAASPAGIALLDPVTLRILAANPSFLDIVGYTEEELRAKQLGDLTHPDDRTDEQKGIVYLLAGTGANYSTTKRYVRKDGAVRWVRLMADHLQQGDAGDILIVNAVDITDRIRIEEAIRLDEARLESLLRIAQHPSTDFQELLEFALDQAIRLTDSKIGYTYLYDEDRQQFTLNNWSRNVMSECRVVKTSAVYQLQHTGLWGEAVRQRRPIIDNDYGGAGPLKKGLPEGHVPLSRFLTVPVFSDDRIVAVTGVANKGRNYDERDARQLILIMDAAWKVVLQRRAEADREESIRRLRLATDAAKLGVWDWDVAANRMLWDARMHEMYGIEPGGAPTVAIWSDRLHPDDKERALAEVRDSLAGKGAFDTVFRIVLPAGEVRHIRAHGLVARDPEGQPLRMLGVNRDITAQYRVEREYRQLFESMLDGFALHEVIVDESGAPVNYRFLAVNPAFERMLGLKASEVVGRTVLELMPETEKFWIESYGRVALGGEPVAFENYSSVLDKYFQVSAFQPVYRQFACIFREITDRVKAEQERRKLETQLRQAQKLEAIGTLAGGIAHDFNNILAAILGYAEIAREDSQPDSSLIGDIDQIIVAGNRARALVQQILAFSRQAEIEQIPLRLSIIAREAIKLLRSSLPSTIRIIADIDHETGLVLADPTQVHQVLMNLCTNAYHAMEKQGGVLRISLRQRALAMAEIEDNSEALPGEYVQLTVTDTGPGIPPEIRDRIFDPYFTTKEQGKGTGLGLAIVRGIVIGCGGFITCRSTVGEGSEFCASLPAIKREEKPGAARQADAEEETGSETILFVDDEEMLVSMGVTMLQRMGYRVTGCSDSRAALELFRQTPRDFDLVITDQTMPYLTGIDLAAAILEIRPEMPIILCTGYSNLVSEEKAMAAGIKGFAIKPLTRKDVATMIRMVLKQESDTSWTEPVN